MQISQDLAGKVYVVTGANSGIGFEAAKDFASRGATVALVCRSEERGLKACATITQATGNSNVKLYLADFCLLASVASLATELLQDYPQIDVLCNNAGSVNAGRKETPEGFETTFVANHLSGFLLTYRLLPALVKAGEAGRARVVFTSSLGHKNSPLDFADLNLEKAYSAIKAYGRSKLMNLLTARELHRRYRDKNIIASSFHPGAVRTSIWAKGGILGRLVGLLAYPFMVSIKQGTDTFIWLASSDDEASIQADGNYFYQRRQPSIASFATDEAADKLWQASLKLIEPYIRPVD
ncbi:MAG: short-chain dehydrogenase [Gammaproteobacteria bacterium]|jgi:NAD(P)-dependent dehydrogenase (short-subunit alcohol dehydrogenase family)|nr:short-chain dehydrogenase [Gammaproteobacteria bacterium]HJO11735.1 SDR family oxidoreductase [Gammaproteobacteria bacterium]|tara:strand:+ start:15155 stop:16039 length:885 start_codon:yes stop_codon:yes gene_type:complete